MVELQYNLYRRSRNELSNDGISPIFYSLKQKCKRSTVNIHNFSLNLKKVKKIWKLKKLHACEKKIFSKIFTQFCSEKIL